MPYGRWRLRTRHRSRSGEATPALMRASIPKGFGHLFAQASPWYLRFVPDRRRWYWLDGPSHLGLSALFPSYHSIVFRRPSSKDVPAEKPKRSRARLVSRARRGWPSGLVASQRNSPPKRASRAISTTRSLIVISEPTPRFTGSASSY